MNGKRRVTITDVAERAGVSRSLVSLVLQNSPLVAERRRQAVLDAMRELDYRPNANARRLATQRSESIGVLLNDLANPLHATFVAGIESVLDVSGFTPVLANAGGSKNTGDRAIATFLDFPVDGAILLGTLRPSPLAEQLVERMPVVVAGARSPRLAGAGVVTNDDAVGAALVAEHLIELGHRHVAHIAGSGEVADLRRRSFVEACAQHGIRVTVTEVVDHDEEAGASAAARLLEDPSITAIFGYNDRIAIGALGAAEDSGLAVPSRLSIVGYDNTSVAALPRISLTSVDSRAFEIGRIAAKWVLEAIDSDGPPPTWGAVIPTLEVRRSTAPPHESRNMS